VPWPRRQRGARARGHAGCAAGKASAAGSLRNYRTVTVVSEYDTIVKDVTESVIEVTATGLADGTRLLMKGKSSQPTPGASNQYSFRPQRTLPTISKSLTGSSSLAWFALSEMIFTRIGRDERTNCRRLITMLPMLSRMA